MEKKRQTIVLGGEIDETQRRKLIIETGYYRNLDHGRKPEADEEETEEP